MTDTARSASAIAWFEIPVTDFARAVAFYEAVLGAALARETMGGMQMGLFPYATGEGVGGCVILDPEGRLKPSADGTTVYLAAGPDLAPALARVAGAGGTVVIPKSAIGGGMGHFAQFIDSEGNRVGLYSMG